MNLQLSFGYYQSSILTNWIAFVLLISHLNAQFSYKNIEDDLSYSQSNEYGQLTGDVKNWGAIIQNYIIQVFLFYKRLILIDID